ncbi:response regulator [Streptomyces sp. NPDC021020]|uniref:response regulator transcription factor n=1 Tax=Streptomyces sp. NPDC021020 TaxID=3365109 RepID=UPI00378AB7EC
MSEKGHDGHIRVFVVDDHDVVRRGVNRLLSGDPSIEIVGEASDTAEAVDRVPDAHPDVAVLDVRLPDGSGVEACREIRSHDESVKCLMLTSFADDEALFDAVMGGAAGYVPKVITGDDLIGAVREVAAGHSLIDPAATAEVLERLREGGARGGEPGERPGRLSTDEREFLDLIGEGLTNREIAERAGLDERTVRRQVSQLLHKLGMARDGAQGAGAGA